MTSIMLLLHPYEFRFGGAYEWKHSGSYFVTLTGSAPCTAYTFVLETSHAQLQHLDTKFTQVCFLRVRSTSHPAQYASWTAYNIVKLGGRCCRYGFCPALNLLQQCQLLTRCKPWLDRANYEMGGSADSAMNKCIRLLIFRNWPVAGDRMLHCQEVLRRDI